MLDKRKCILNLMVINVKISLNNKARSLNLYHPFVCAFLSSCFEF